MKTTFAIPCYNGAAYIRQAIESVLRQSVQCDEVLIVDDGSTDESRAVIKQYPVTLIVHPQNRGLANARNSAIEAATGEVVIFMDADAVADEDFVKTLIAGYTANEDVAGIGGQGIETNIHSRADRWRRAHAEQSYGDHERNVAFLYGLCMSFRVPVLRDIGGFSTTFRTNAEDMDVGLRLRASGYRLLYLPEAKVFHQRRDDVASLKRTMAAWYRGAYYAKKKNRASPWTLFAGTLRRLLMDPIKDIFVIHDISLVPLSLSISWVKFKALYKASLQTEL